MWFNIFNLKFIIVDNVTTKYNVLFNEQCTFPIQRLKYRTPIR